MSSCQWCNRELRWYRKRPWMRLLGVHMCDRCNNGSIGRHRMEDK